MAAEREILRRHVKSMNDRLQCLEKMAGAGDSAGGGEEDELSLKIEEMNDQVSNTVGRTKVNCSCTMKSCRCCTM